MLKLFTIRVQSSVLISVAGLVVVTLGAESPPPAFCVASPTTLSCSAACVNYIQIYAQTNFYNNRVIN